MLKDKVRNYIDYEKITDNANKLLSDEVDRRDKIKQDLEARANDLYDQLGKVEMNSDSRFSDQVLDAATQIRKSLMLDQQLLKKGQISVNEYKQQLERAKQQMAEWGVITKEFGKYKDDYNAKRLQIDEETGEPIMAPDEMIIKESSLGFSYTYDKQIYVDPITKIPTTILLIKMVVYQILMKSPISLWLCQMLVIAFNIQMTENNTT